MLVFGRRVGEEIVIGGDSRISVVAIPSDERHPNTVRHTIKPAPESQRPAGDEGGADMTGSQ